MMFWEILGLLGISYALGRVRSRAVVRGGSPSESTSTDAAGSPDPVIPLEEIPHSASSPQ